LAVANVRSRWQARLSRSILADMLPALRSALGHGVEQRVFVVDISLAHFHLALQSLEHGIDHETLKA